jgi:hypothetical protein
MQVHSAIYVGKPIFFQLVTGDVFFASFKSICSKLAGQTGETTRADRLVANQRQNKGL